MNPRKIIVTGCSRTGTQFTAMLLGMCGLRAGHESIYSYRTQANEIALKWAALGAEVSWQAPPFAWSFPNDCIIWHQLRHPLKSLRCYLHTGLLSDGTDRTTIWLREQLPECLEGDNLERGAKFLLGWNEMIERDVVAHDDYRRFRVEDLNADLLADLLTDAGWPADKAAQAVEKVPLNMVGACRSHGPDELSWDCVGGELGERLRAMGERYGYR